MLSFKQQIQKDLDAFINPNEFGESHKIKVGDKGKEKTITLVIDNEELMRRQSLRSIHDDGIFRAQILFYCKGTDLGRLPKVDTIITLDNDKYRVCDAKDEKGMYAVILEKNSSRGLP